MLLKAVIAACRKGDVIDFTVRLNQLFPPADQVACMAAHYPGLLWSLWVLSDRPHILPLLPKLIWSFHVQPGTSTTPVFPLLLSTESHAALDPWLRDRALNAHGPTLRRQPTKPSRPRCSNARPWHALDSWPCTAP